MRKKTKGHFLILGGGYGQLPMIEGVQKLGLKALVVDMNPNCLGAKKADVFFPINIIDNDAILSLAIKYQILGVSTMQTDKPIPTMGFLNEKLNLNGVSKSVAEDCSIKTRTRIKLKDKNIAQPKFEIVSNSYEALRAAEFINFPVIIKATDSSGSRGVVKVSKRSEVENAVIEAFKYTKLNTILVEEFIDGLEIGAQAFSVNGICQSVLVHNDTIAPGEFMVPIGHSFPSSLSTSELHFAEQNVKACVEALGIENGPSNIDLILDKKDGKAKIIEVGARIGATCLPELVFHYSGIDWVESTILNAMNVPVKLEFTKKEPVAAIILQSQIDGIFNGVEINSDILNDVNLLDFEVTAKKGEKVSKLRKGTDRIGKIVSRGLSYNEAEANCRAIQSKINFLVDGAS